MMQTPFEASGQWTSRDDGEAFLEAVTTAHDVPLVTLGHSVENRPIRAALIGAHPDTASQVGLLVALQHGNETAGREGAFAVLRDLAQTTDPATLSYLQDTAWVIIPTLNIDRLMIARQNANWVDLNRDYEDATQPETAVVQYVLDTWQPTVILDAHEINSPFNADVGLGIPSIAEVHTAIRQLSAQARDHIAPQLIASGSDYMHFPASSVMGLRNWGGLHHAVTLLTETYALNDEREPALRVQDHVTVFHALIEHHIEHYDTYRRIADQSRHPATFQGSAPPYFDMWQNPVAIIQDKRITDAYLHTPTGKVRVYDQLSNLLN